MRDDRVGAAGVVALIVALAAGSCIGYIDSRATWDDAGVTAAALVAAGALIAAVRPRAWWLVGLAVGAPVVAFNIAIHGNVGSAVAIAFSLIGAGIGASFSRILRQRAV